MSATGKINGGLLNVLRHYLADFLRPRRLKNFRCSST
jgi:hypothetical protein